MRYLRNYFQIYESKKTEAEGLNILKKANIENPEEIINKIKTIDGSINQVNIPIIASLYVGGNTDINNLKGSMDVYNDLLSKKRITPVSLSKGADNSIKLKIADKIFDTNPSGYIKFREYIDGKKPAQTISKEEIMDERTEDKPIWAGNNIEIYDANDMVKCIRYCQGDLTGRTYEFCIGKYGAENMFNSYRDNDVSTFYFIVDNNKDKSDPLHLVVFDHEQNGIKLTDVNNTTTQLDGGGGIAEYGDDVDKYVDYLKSKGVPVDTLLVNKPKTAEEIEEDRILRNENSDLSWFIKLPIELKSKYVGRGHMLTDEQFDYLME